MAELVLWFTKSQGTSQLERTLFITSSGAEIVAIRGRASGAYRNAGVFQWTPGVRALAVSFLKALAHHRKGVRTYLPLLEGERGSIAASLNYALYKQPAWLFEMFGADDGGNALLRALLLRSNLSTGKVAISLNEDLLSPGSIKVHVGALEIKDADELEKLASEIISQDGGDSLAEPNASVTIPTISGMVLAPQRTPFPIGRSLSEPDNIYLFEQLQSASQATSDRIGLNINGLSVQPPAVFGRVVQAKHLFEELTYQTCDARTRDQFEQWLAAMIPERDGEWGLDRQKDGEAVAGFLRWVREQNKLFGPNGFYRTFIWRDRLTGEMVATATMAPDDRGVSARYQLPGDGHIGGINVRWDLRCRGIGKYMAARLNQHIREFAKRESKSKLIHTYNYNFGGIPLPFLQSIGYVQHSIGPVQTDFGPQPLWSKEYTMDNSIVSAASMPSG